MIKKVISIFKKIGQLWEDYYKWEHDRYSNGFYQHERIEPSGVEALFPGIKGVDTATINWADELRESLKREAVIDKIMGDLNKPHCPYCKTDFIKTNNGLDYRCVFNDFISEPVRMININADFDFGGNNEKN